MRGTPCTATPSGQYVFIPLTYPVSNTVRPVAARWVEIKVPPEFKAKVRRLATRKKTAMWKVLAQALEFYERASIRYGSIETDRAQKLVYQAGKALISLGMFLENASPTNLEWLRKNLAALEREGIDVSVARELADRYYYDRDKQLRVALREAMLNILAQALAGGAQ